VPMLSSVKGRIILGFGVVMALLIAATIVNVTLVSSIGSDFDQFQAALNRKSRAVDIDLVMQKVRVRVNQWLRSPGNESFALQANQLLTQATALMTEARNNAKTEKERQTLGEMDRALKAYIESWHVIQGLYGDEARIYDEKIVAPGSGIRADLAKLRDDDGIAPATSRLIATARDDFMNAESLAMQYRGGLKPGDADELKASIGHAIAALNQAAPEVKGADSS